VSGVFVDRFAVHDVMCPIVVLALPACAADLPSPAEAGFAKAGVAASAA
jgi:hypothetical protein